LPEEVTVLEIFKINNIVLTGLWIQIRNGSEFNDLEDPKFESGSPNRIQGQKLKEKCTY
jgi:hypothetical protein